MDLYFQRGAVQDESEENNIGLYLDFCDMFES